MNEALISNRRARSTLRRRLRRFGASRSGGVATTLGLALPLLIGVTALGVDGGILYHRHAVLQTVSDVSAISGALALAQGHDAAVAEALAIASNNGYPTGVRGATITPNHPPASGARAGDMTAVEVIVVGPQRPFMSRLFHPEDYVLRTRSVASFTIQPGCILALNPAGARTVSVSGSAELKVPGCDIYANSNAVGAVGASGAGSIDVKSISTPGTVTGKKIVAQSIVTGPQVETLPNPYANVRIPPAGTCMPAPPPLKTFTLSPGRYCGGLNISGAIEVTLLPGVYVIDGGDLRIGGGKVTGDGVTFILTSYTAAPPASVTIGGSSDVYLTAPATGEYAGIVFYADPKTPTGTVQSFQGGGDQYIGGAIVAPTSVIHYGGSRGALSGPSCTQLVGWSVEFKGNSELKADCKSLGAKEMGAKTVTLVE